jgi:hypothetical protein
VLADKVYFSILPFTVTYQREFIIVFCGVSGVVAFSFAFLFLSACIKKTSLEVIS